MVGRWGGERGGGGEGRGWGDVGRRARWEVVGANFSFKSLTVIAAKESNEATWGELIVVQSMHLTDTLNLHLSCSKMDIELFLDFI